MRKIKQLVMMLSGTLLVAAANTLFFAPNKIVCGGVGGISTILRHMFNIPLSISYAAINLVLLALGLKILGKEFIVKTLIGTMLMSVFTEILSQLPLVTENTMLAAVFGGLAYGVGLGIIFVKGATTGGTDILGRLIQIKYPNISIGVLMMLIDAVIIAASLAVFKNMDLVLFGIIGIFLQTVALELLIKRLNVSKMAFIISDYGDKICDNLIENFTRGVTIIDAHGGYSKNDKQLLLCALKMGEMNELQRRIKAIDPQAFVIFSESQYVMGNGFVIYR